MMRLTQDQLGVAKGMAAAFVASLAVWSLPVLLLPPPEIMNEAANRIAFALPSQLPPLLTLLYGIAWLAQYRFFNAAAIHGSNSADDKRLQSGRAYLENTVEQVLLFFITSMTLAVVLPINWLQVLPVLAFWFAFCRLLFRIGYAHGARARAFGFAGTFYPTVIGIAVALWFTLFS